ncbi:MAG: hypothetical protein HUU16_17675 [Candidatus Omnitrophica bacterium]|nr:hypothetical protein [Candidatus Omnitrophota bacterium]
MKRLVSLCSVLLGAFLPSAAFANPEDAWKSGPYLFLDNAWIAASTNLERRITPPDVLPDPIVTGRKEDGSGDNCFQPYLTVLRDPESGRFRMWYGVPESSNQSHLAYMESEDGNHWVRPHRVLEDPARIQFGCAVVDRGPKHPNPAERFAYGFYGDKDGAGGLRIAVSPDGLAWRMTEGLLRHSHDITWLGWDPIRSRFLAFVSMMKEGPGWSESRRIPHQSVSRDLMDWREPWKVVEPEQGEEGEVQFYCMAGAIARGETLVALVKVLRDDLNAETGASAKDMGDDSRKAAGVGYTVLAWSHDGESWSRDIEPFLDRDPRPSEWDRAMVWGDCQLPVGDEIFIYYGGYKRGHKVNRFVERQIGLARMMRDRYVARRADREQATLRTPARILQASGLTLNSRSYSPLRVRLLDAEGLPYPGFGWDDCESIVGDSVAHRVVWRGDLASLAGKSVALEFALTNTDLWAFDWIESNEL